MARRWRRSHDRSASAASRWPDVRCETAPQSCACNVLQKMPSLSIHTLCLVTLLLRNIYGSLEHEIPRRSSLSRRAIDGTRGRKYFDPEEEGYFDSYGSAGGQYDPYEEKTDFSDIRRNVPGEPGIDYPAYTTLPQTGFTCEGRSRGYYADKVAGCQVFHVCHDVLVSSFLCPMGSIFSQKLLTCDWWTKVDCSSSDKYIDVNRNSYQQDDDEMIRNAYAMISLRSGTDVTKDGLVDPDRTASLLGYQQGRGRILDYATVFTAGNDLRNNAQDYPYEFEGRRTYSQKITDFPRYRGLVDDHPIPNEFGKNRFQPSYAPTVPTVTTTTRRFYSPTVPTTFRPSTFAYSKLDVANNAEGQSGTHQRFEEGRNGREAGGLNEESAEDIEARDTVGLVHALRHPLNHSRVTTLQGRREQREQREHTAREQVAASSRSILDPLDHSGQIDSLIYAGYPNTLARPESTVSEERPGNDQGTTEQYQAFLPSTIPSFDESAINATTADLNTNRSEINVEYSNERYPSIDRMDTRLLAYGPMEFFKAPDTTRNKFQINVPDLSQLTLDAGPYPGTRATTRSDENYAGRELPKTFTFHQYRSIPTTTSSSTKPLVSSTGSSHFSIPSVARTTEMEEGACSNENGKACDTTSFIRASSGKTIKPTTPSPSTSYSSECTTIIDASEETPTSLVAKTDDIQCSGTPLSPITEKSAEKLTIDGFLGSIGPETSKQIEESTETNSSPYQVTLTLNRDEELAPVGDHLMSKLIARQGKQTSTFNDNLHELEIVKSVQTEAQGSRSESNLDGQSTDQSNVGNNVTGVVKSSDSNKQNFNSVSLLQLMSELLKLDRAPRPFALTNAHRRSFPVQTIAKDLNLSMQLEKGPPTTMHGQNPTNSGSKTFLSLSKEQILDRLTENFGEPLHRTDQRLASHLAETEMCLDYRTGLPTKGSSRCQNPSSIGPTLSTSAAISSKPTIRTRTRTRTRTSTSTSTKTTTPTPKSILTAVKTEFLPSIGFSFDTDKDREEYVEAVLRGLIEPPQPAESKKIEKSERFASGPSEQPTFSRNGTSGRVQNTNGLRR